MAGVAVRRRRVLAGCIAGVTVAVTSCTAHPGAAAVVEGRTIATSTVDNLAASYCAANRIATQQQGSPNVQPTRDLRRGVLNALIQTQVTEMAARKLGVRVSPAQVHEMLSASSTLPPRLDATDKERITGLLERITKAQLLTQGIGEKLLGKDPASASSEEGFRRGSRYVASYAAKLGISVDPRYGTYGAQGIGVQSGSLSVAESNQAQDAVRASIDQAWASRLPASQTCG